MTNVRGISDRPLVFLYLYQLVKTTYPQLNSTLNTYLTPLILWVTAKYDHDSRSLKSWSTAVLKTSEKMAWQVMNAER